MAPHEPTGYATGVEDGEAGLPRLGCSVAVGGAAAGDADSVGDTVAVAHRPYADWQPDVMAQWSTVSPQKPYWLQQNPAPQDAPAASGPQSAAATPRAAHRTRRHMVMAE